MFKLWEAIMIYEPQEYIGKYFADAVNNILA